MILIACRADPSVGFGHLMRSRALSDIALGMGIKTVLIGPSKDLMDSSDHDRFAAWIAYDVTKHDYEACRMTLLLDSAKKMRAHHVILDDYTFTGENQMDLYRAGLRTMQQYDASCPPMFAVDFAVNASPAERAEFHAGRLFRNDVQFLNGPQYAVLRPAFFEVNKQNAGRPVRRILVTFGGGDDRGGILFTISSLSPKLPKDIKLVIMTGENNPNIPQIRDFIAKSHSENIILEISNKKTAELIASCDLAIMAGGTSIYEAAYCGLPMILIAIAPNQYGQCKGWESLGAAQFLGQIDEVRSDDLISATFNVLSNQEMRENMALRGMMHVDLHGGKRLLNALLDVN